MQPTTLFEKILDRVSRLAIKRKKRLLAERFDRQFNSIVAYGPFKGLKLPAYSWWGKSDRAAMLFGFYEQEVQAALFNKPAQYDTFIDIGAADGYYALGAVVSGQFKKSICYESSEKGRLVIAENARLNNVEHLVEINGMATREVLKEFCDDGRMNSVILVDIEGGEFDLFDDALLERIKKNILIIEIHDFLFPDGDEKRMEFQRLLEKHFKVSVFSTSKRDLSPYAELWKLADTDRWLLCSENRPVLMSWIRLDPL
jgi:Methyltransferase FkbM domain